MEQFIMRTTKYKVIHLKISWPWYVLWNCMLPSKISHI